MKANFSIERKCLMCGKNFIAKTLTSYYCSRACTNKAYKMRKKAKQKEERLRGIAADVDPEKEYLSIKEAAAIYNISAASL